MKAVACQVNRLDGGQRKEAAWDGASNEALDISAVEVKLVGCAPVGLDAGLARCESVEIKGRQVLRSAQIGHRQRALQAVGPCCKHAKLWVSKNGARERPRKPIRARVEHIKTRVVVGVYKGPSAGACRGEAVVAEREHNKGRTVPKAGNGPR